MAEIIRQVVVTVVVDTNKQTRQRKLVLVDDETLAEFKARIDETVNQLTGIE